MRERHKTGAHAQVRAGYQVEGRQLCGVRTQCVIRRNWRLPKASLTHRPKDARNLCDDAASAPALSPPTARFCETRHLAETRLPGLGLGGLACGDFEHVMLGIEARGTGKMRRW
jgi:hypothetical protein